MSILMLLCLTSLYAKAKGGLQYSANLVIHEGAEGPIVTRVPVVETVKIYSNGQAFRLDMPGYRGAIVHASTSKVYAPGFNDVKVYEGVELDHTRKEYSEILGDTDPIGVHMSFLVPYDPESPCKTEKRTTCTKSGQETVNGRRCDMWNYINEQEKWSIWLDQSTHLAVKVVMAETTYSLENFKEGPQDSKLFRIPVGYRKYKY